MGRGSKVIFDNGLQPLSTTGKKWGGIMERKQKDSYVSDYRFRLKNCWNPKNWVVIVGQFDTRTDRCYGLGC